MIQSFLTNIKDALETKLDKLCGSFKCQNTYFSGVKCLYTGLFSILNDVLNDRFIDLASSAFLLSIAIMILIIAISSFNNCCENEQACKERAM